MSEGRGAPVYREISESIKRNIASGQWTAKLPGLRELASQFSVNIKTVNKAIELLVQEGLLYCSPGLGTFVLQGGSAGGKSLMRVGLILSDVSNPNFAQMAQIMQEVSHEQGISILMNTTSRKPDVLRGILAQYRSSGVQVVFIQGGALRSKTERDILRTFAIPTIGSHVEDPDIDNIHPDMKEGAYIVTTHLLRTFNGPVGFVSGSDEPVAQTGRFRGYCDAHIALRRSLDFGFVYETQPSFRGGYDSVKDIIRARNIPRSILLYNEEMAMGAVSALIEAGIRIPHDVGLACFDDSIDPTTMIIPLTTVSYSNREMADMLFKLAHLRISKPQAPRIIKEIEMHLIIRESTML